jgi:hypothetical protein
VDELDLVRGLSRGVPAVDAGAESQAFDRLAVHVRDHSSRSSSTGSRPWSLAAAAAVMVFVAAIGVVVGPSVLRRDASAAATLRELAAIAAAQPFALEPGDYVYARSYESIIDGFTPLDGPPFEARIRTIREIWKARDGSGRILERSDVPEFLTIEDETAWRAAGSPPLGTPTPSDERFGPGEFPGPDLSGLPSDPESLRVAIGAGSVIVVQPGSDGLFDAVGQLLAERTAPADVRAALFEIAAGIPNVTAVGDIEDPLGRPGIGVELEGESGPTTLIFDPTTSMLLAIEEVWAGGEETWTAYEPASVVGDIEERP